MISEETREQLGQLKLEARRPLVISDVDDVVVHFLRSFETYLDRNGLWLDPVSLALSGNIRRKTDSIAIEQKHVERIIDDFFTDMTLHMEPIDQAVEMLTDIGAHANVVLLTNAPHSVGEDRRSNLRKHGLHFPVITNSGPKGPAIKALSSLSGGTTVFIDDNPGFLKSAHEWVPDIHLVHFMPDWRFRRHVKPMEFVHLHTDTWSEVGQFVLDAVQGRNGQLP